MQHVFQPMDLDFVEINPFTKIGNDWFLVTAGDETKVNTMTAGWGGFGVIWAKKVVYIFIRKSRYTKEFIDKHDTFSISFMDKSQHAALKYLGQVSGRNEDKIAGARLNIDFYEGTPYIDESSEVYICRKLSATELTPDQFIDPEIKDKFYGDNDLHIMYVGEITQFMAR